MGAVRLARVLTGDIVRSLGRWALRGVRRDAGRVAAEYDQGHWRRVLDQRAWEAGGDLRAYLCGADRRPRLALVEGRAVECASDVYYSHRIDGLQRLIAREAGDDPDVVELGCGYGHNLFSLALDPRWRGLAGLDISENGLQAARAIAGHFGVADRIRFDLVDLTRADHPGFARIAGRTVFTFFCLEQVPHAVESVLRNILRARPRRVIHVEPTTERTSPWRLRDLANRVYVRSKDYQCRLFGAAERMARAGEIRVLTDGRADFAPTLHNDGFVLAWEPA